MGLSFDGWCLCRVAIIRRSLVDMEFAIKRVRIRRDWEAEAARMWARVSNTLPQIGEVTEADSLTASIAEWEDQLSRFEKKTPMQRVCHVCRKPLIDGACRNWRCTRERREMRRRLEHSKQWLKTEVAS